MKQKIRKILKEEGEGLKERFLKNMKSLEYIIQSNVNNDIEEIEFVALDKLSIHNYLLVYCL